MRITCILLLLLVVCAETKRGGGRGRGRGSSVSRVAGRKTSRGGGSGLSRYAPASRISRSYRNLHRGLRSSLMMRRRGGLIIVPNPAEPFLFAGRSYFWGVTHFRERKPAFENGTICQLILNNTEEFEDVYLVNETKPEMILWECPRDNWCCGVECCPIDDYRVLQALTVFVIIFGFVAIVLAMLCCFTIARDIEFSRSDAAARLLGR